MYLDFSPTLDFRILTAEVVRDFPFAITLNQTGYVIDTSIRMRLQRNAKLRSVCIHKIESSAAAAKGLVDAKIVDIIP